MPSYRFCRPDDLTLIVTAINQCYRIHYPHEPEMTIDRFKQLITLYDIRPGNCMVAQENRKPVGVVISTKRDYGSWIQAIGCKPGFQRRGIARQLVEALLRKIYIQGVPLVTVDVPEENIPAQQFFEAMNFTIRGRYISYRGDLSPCLEETGEIEVVSSSELLTYHATFHSCTQCWERNAESLAGYGNLPHGYAYREQGALRGYLLYWHDTLLDLAIDPQTDMERVGRALFGSLRREGISQASLSKVPENDPLSSVLEKLGLTPFAYHLFMGQDLR